VIGAVSPASAKSGDLLNSAGRPTAESANPTIIRMNHEYVALMKRSGLIKLHLGVESGSQRIADLVQKDVKIKDSLKVNRLFADFDITMQYNFMCGFPTETSKDLQATVDLCLMLVKENRHAIISPFCTYSPYPGTQMYELAVKSGFREPKTLEEWAKLEYGETPWVSGRLRSHLKALFLVSHFAGYKAEDMVGSRFMSLLFRMYKPIARFRFRHQFFALMPEMAVKDWVIGRMDR
jgi:anaerobic magnesium-protoporphyrin IX monomethyl ester cyclase